jgi:ankyrin repeat protein
MSLFQTNLIFQAINSNSSNALNNAIINGEKINVSDDSENAVTSLDYAILTLKYSMVKPILVYVNLLLPSEKTKMLNSGLKTLVKCMEKYVNANREENLSDDMVVFNDLKNAGADLSLVVNTQENLYLYHYAIKLNSAELFDILVSSNIDSNVCDAQGNNILMYAFMYDRRNFISTLITRSDNLTCVQNYSKKSFLHFAVERNYYEIAVQLLTSAPELLYLKDEDSKTALHYVVELYTKEIAHTYIDYFAGTFGSEEASLQVFVNAQDFRGDTALHYIIEKANVYSSLNPGACNCMIKKLVSKGASLYVKNSRGLMPIDLHGVSKEFIHDIC